MSVFTGHCVMLPVPNPDSQEHRQAWLQEIYAWLLTIEGDYDLMLIRKGAILTKEDVLSDNMMGIRTVDEHIIWFFAEMRDAQLFKMKWADE